MYEILVVLLVLIAAARRRGSGRRRRFSLRKVRLTPTLAIGGLVTLDVTSAAATSALTNTLRIMSLDMTWSIVDLGAATDDGFEFGVAHSDYSAAEIEECLEATTSMDLGDKVAQERANRLVRTIGIISGNGIAGGGGVLNDGRPVKTRLNWLLSIGDTLNVWVRNGSSANYTTGANLIGQGVLWVKD